jgi:hypothetical protein
LLELIKQQETKNQGQNNKQSQIMTASKNNFLLGKNIVPLIKSIVLKLKQHAYNFSKPNKIT